MAQGKYAQLSGAERDQICQGLARGWSARAIVRTPGRSPNTIVRELARHGARAHDGATRAQNEAVSARHQLRGPRT